MSIIFMATSLSAVGASALTVGALALRQALAKRTAKKTAAEVTPIQAFGQDYAALATNSHSTVIADTSDTFRWNSVKLDDPRAALRQIGALQAQLTTKGGLNARHQNPSFSLQGDKGDVA